MHLFYQHMTKRMTPPNLNSLYETDGLGGGVLWLKTLTQHGFQPFSYLQEKWDMKTQKTRNRFTKQKISEI